MHWSEELANWMEKKMGQALTVFIAIVVICTLVGLGLGLLIPAVF